jgi:tetrahydromethanopterin S-methyltransferase subunit B
MTTSNDRLDRIELTIERISNKVEKNADAVEKNAHAIDQLTSDIGRFNDRLDNYEKGMRWVIQLSFGLLISATVALIVSALTLLVKTVVGQ